jgi:hypothetical protein
MTQTCEGPPRFPRADGPLEELSSYGGVDNHPDALKIVPSQEDNRASEITCASMRADELRGCLVREILCAMAIGMQAQAALLDGDDDAALANLRRHWTATRASITPLACELLALRKAGTPL